MALAGAMLVAPAGAQAAAVTVVPGDPEGLERDGHVTVRDSGLHRNDLEVRIAADAVTVTEHASVTLTARAGCRQRSAQVVVCPVSDPDNFVWVYAGRGDDRVRGRCGDPAMAMIGGAGNDVLESGGCGVFLSGGPGRDVLVGDSSRQELYGGGGNDRLFGRGGNDVLFGDGSANRRGDDLLDGGPGLDIAGWDERSDGIRADIRRGLATHAHERDRLVGVENLSGTQGNDVLAGDDRPNRLLGAAGRDLLIGRGGSDTLNGGSGSILYSVGDDEAPDGFRCGGGNDLVRFPGRSPVPVGCERFSFGPYGAMRARPPAAGPHSVEIPTLCDFNYTSCRRRVVVRAGRRILGQTGLAQDPPERLPVRLTAAATGHRTVTIVVEGDDLDTEADPPVRYAYRASWRLGCAGAPRRDVCRIGG